MQASRSGYAWEQTEESDCGMPQDWTFGIVGSISEHPSLAPLMSTDQSVVCCLVYLSEKRLDVVLCVCVFTVLWDVNKFI